jgi:hypothetical protein
MHYECTINALWINFELMEGISAMFLIRREIKAGKDQV